MPNTTQEQAPRRGRAPAANAWTAFVTARRKKELRQKDVASHLRVHTMAVSAWERGLYPPDHRHWASLRDLLELSYAEIAEHAASFSAPVTNSDY